MQWQLTNLTILEKISKKDNVDIQQKINRKLLLEYRYLNSFLLNQFPNRPTEFFATIKRQPIKKQGED